MSIELTINTEFKPINKDISKLEKKLMHYMGKAIADFNMLENGDRVMICLSGGKDSFTMLKLMRKIIQRSGKNIKLLSYTLDQSQPGWDDRQLRQYLDNLDIEYVIETKDTYSVVIDKIPEGKTYCSLCSRLRRGNIYRYAKEHGYNKIALGHHRDDLIETLLMSIFYNGEIRSMPPKLLTDDKQLLVIRPMAYLQEKDIARYSALSQFPIIPCNLCGSQENLSRKNIKALIKQLAAQNPKIPSNMLHAISNVSASQLMDSKLWDFKSLRADID